MVMQLILCMETNKRANTDFVYIKETIQRFYDIGKTNINKVYLGTKSKYKSKDILNEIKKMTKAYVIGNTKVIYCIDTDDYEKNSEHKQELNDIRRFCKENDYDLIWFCHDIEEVFIGKKIPASQKVKEAETFRRKEEIGKVDCSNLSSDRMIVHNSNILNVLDKYLTRK